MSTTAKLEKSSVQLAAGGIETIPLQIRNNSEIVEGYRFEVLGVPGAWATVEPAEITGLFPGAETTATVSFNPPRSASVPAGQLSFGIRVIPTQHPEQAVVPEGMVEVLPFLETTAELVPRTSRGRGGAVHHVAVDNRGNAPITVSLEAVDAGELLELTARPATLTVEPGHAAFADLKVKPRKRIWRGEPVTHQFTVSVLTDLTSTVTLDGTHLQERTLPRWLPKALLALLGLLVLLALAWFLLFKPTIESAARAAVEEPVAEAAQQAEEAAAQAQQAGEQAGQASNAAQAAQGSAAAAGDAATQATDLVGDPSLTNLVVPVADRLAATTPAGGQSSRTFIVPTDATLRLTDFVMSNPQGDFGRVEVTFGDRTLFDLALENFRSVDFHFQEPIVGGEGAELEMTVRCDEVGVPPAQNPAPTTCDTAVFYGGTLLQPREESE
ncbi:COG1470 family protein [Georgenia sp. MJ170]|uniref:COG1470 family protein n=1 Tax=Georgenia sunbinii TaxID=3117728 RepID=UPI002F26C163